MHVGNFCSVHTDVLTHAVAPHLKAAKIHRELNKAALRKSEKRVKHATSQSMYIHILEECIVGLLYAVYTEIILNRSKLCALLAKLEIAVWHRP